MLQEELVVMYGQLVCIFLKHFPFLFKTYALLHVLCSH